MELLSLPVELIHKISSYLPVEDVMSCSLTCHHLRNVLNDNAVWRRYLPEEDITCLESEEQQVQPAFHPPVSLTCLCTNRLHFMRKVHLLNNWRQGNFTAHVLQDACSSNFIPDGIRSTIRGREQLLYGDKYLFLSAYFGGFEAIEVWNIDKEPVIHSTLQFESFLFDEYFQIVGSQLVFFDCCKVSVFGITVPDKIFPLMYSILADKEEIVRGEFGRNLRHETACLGWCHYVVGQNLISIRHGQLFFHVWRLQEPKKLGIFNILSRGSLSFETPETPYNRNVLSMECFSNDDIILSTHLPVESCYYIGFNLSKKDFSGFELSYVGKIRYMMMNSQFVVVFTLTDGTMTNCDSICTLYDFKTSQKLRERRFNDAGRNFDLKKTKIINGKFVMLCIGRFEVIDLRTLDTTYYFDCESAYFITQILDVLGSVFVVVCNEDFHLEIWDVKNKKKCCETVLSGKHSESRIYYNRTCTKMVCFDWVVGSIVILNLW